MSSSESTMQIVSPSSLVSLPSRIEYLKSFLDFTPADVAYLHAAAPVVKPLIPTIVDLVYVKLLSYDITAKAFVARNTGFEGKIDENKKATDVRADDEQIKFRKGFLRMYLAKLVEMDYGEKSWEYLDKVAVMHTGRAGFAHREGKPALRVELIHLSILLGYVVDIVLDAVVKHPDLDNDTKAGVLRALNKVIWIQNDLFARQYSIDEDSNIVPIRFPRQGSQQRSLVPTQKVLPMTVLVAVGSACIGWLAGGLW